MTVFLTNFMSQGLPKHFVVPPQQPPPLFINLATKCTEVGENSSSTLLVQTFVGTNFRCNKILRVSTDIGQIFRFSHEC